AAVGLLPQGPPARIGGQEVEAAERRPHDPLLAQRDRHDPGIAPQLAVSDDVEAGGLLERDGLPHGAIFHGAKLGIRDGAGAHAGARLTQVGRAQQAADDIRASSHQISPYRLLRYASGRESYRTVPLFAG